MRCALILLDDFVDVGLERRRVTLCEMTTYPLSHSLSNLADGAHFIKNGVASGKEGGHTQTHYNSHAKSHGPQKKNIKHDITKRKRKRKKVLQPMQSIN